MNSSSGIKRGLAATAVAALAVTGIPALASSASAEAGDSITFVSAGPTLNGGSEGGVVRLKASASVTEDDLDGTESTLALSNPNLNGSPNNGNQQVDIVDYTFIAEDAPGDSANDGLNEILVDVAVTTPDAGMTATYAIYLDDTATPGVQAGEARTQVSQSTSGPLASIEVLPASQSAAQGIASGAYTATLKDAAGRTTQLDGGDTVGVTIAPDGTVTQPVLDATELQLGAATFTAQAPTTGAKTITLNPSSLTDPAGNATATLNVTAAANITAADVDIVTAADSWHGFGNPNDSDGDPAVTLVRVDQGSIRIDFKGGVADANSTVTLGLDGGAAPNGITFGGKRNATVTTVLDANGVGSVTITPDAFTVQEGESIAISGSFAQTLLFERVDPTAVAPAADLYFSALKATTTVTATVVDQFGNPVTSGFVSAFVAAGPNQGTPPGQVKPVAADGTVSFDFTDTKAAIGQQDTIALNWVPDQFTQVPGASGSATIKYTATGQGADFTTELDNKNTGAPTYKASDVSIIPLADTDADSADEAADLEVLGGEPNQAVTLSVDNGALILAPGEDELSEGSATAEATTNGGGDLPAGYQIIGTESGVATLTVSSANRTETAQFTVAATEWWAARNIAVSGPATVESGTTQIPFVAVITDAFGNPVQGFGVNDLNIQVTGPAQFQDSDAMTNEMGQLNLNVRVDSDAVGDVSIKVTGLDAQFGANADQVFPGDPANNGKGLSASSNVANATTTVTAPELIDPELVLSGSSKQGKDKIKANAIPEAEGATVKLFVNGKKKKVGTLNASGNFTFSIKDKNGNKKTKYVVKVARTQLTDLDQATRKQK